MSSRRPSGRHSSHRHSSGNTQDKSDRKRRHRIHKAEDLLQRLSHKVVKRRYHLLEDYSRLVGDSNDSSRSNRHGNESKISLDLNTYPIHKSIVVWNSGDLVAHKHRRRSHHHKHRDTSRHSSHSRRHSSNHSSMTSSSSHHNGSKRDDTASSSSLEENGVGYSFPVKHQQANYERFLDAAKTLCDDEHLQTIAWMLCNLTSKDPNKEPTAVAYFESPLIPFVEGQKSNLRSMVKFAFTKYNSIVGKKTSSPHQRLDKNKVVGIVLFNPKLQSAIAYTAQYVRHPGHARIKYRPDCKTLKRISGTTLDEALAYRWPAIKTLPIKK